MRRWVGVVAASLSIGWGSLGCGSASVGQGGEGQTCYANATCNAGLTCLSKICVNPDGGVGSGGAAGGHSGSNGAGGAAAGGHAGGGGAPAGGSGGAPAGGASGAAGGASGAAGASYPSHCSNGAVDQQETDIDCGGACPGCGQYQTCATDQDCAIPFNCNAADFKCEI